MKTLIFAFFFTFALTQVASANESATTSVKMPFCEAKPLLHSIEQEAIIIGNGSKTIFVFVDPMCIKSREFIDMIASTPELQAQYTYKIFLSQLSSRFDSKGLIEAIYASENKVDTLIALMALQTEQTSISCNDTNSTVSEKINTIEQVSNKLKVFKRPYIFISTDTKSI